MTRYEPTDRTKVRRLPDRGAYDADVVHTILDEAAIAHVGFAAEGQPYVLPMIHGRIGSRLYLHGAAGGRHLRALAGGTPLCVTATIVDGLALARSAFHHSMNYRCVVVLGAADAVESESEKNAALKAISERLIPGRWDDVRGPTKPELKQTTVVSLDLKECSAKVRVGPPKDDEPDYALTMWAGVAPMRTAFGEPVPDPRLKPGTPVPGYLRKKIGR
jgi:nitroimidazol reductase NimA-like FMN-containing flavoprotein (pyridoxamine 5'-phosphate oxidase superfamily)